MNYRIYPIICFTTAIFMTGSILLPSTIKAKRISMIRDVEIETTIRRFAEPLFLAAGLEPSSIRIHIVKDNTLNAFVAGGQRIFINTGLILKSKNVGQIIGVLAHEIGHIAGGHLIKGTNARKDISATALLGVLLGGAAVIAGRPDAGAAAIQLGSNIGIRNYLSFSRTQESSADRSALRFMEQTQQSATGLLEFMEVLEDQELLSARNQDPYVRTHPLSQNRIEAIRRHLKKSRFTNTPASERNKEFYSRIRAKIVGFTQTFSQTLREYPQNDGSIASIYARTIAHYRKPNISEAIKLINQLTTQHPNDPYFHELKGQIYFENGKIDLALKSYQVATNLIPESPLLRAQLAHVQIEKNEPEFLRMAILNLLYSVNKDPTRPSVWRQLSIAYGRLNKKGESSQALAEEAILLGRNNEAIKLAERAKKLLKIGTTNWLRAEDIINLAHINLKKKRVRKQ